MGTPEKNRRDKMFINKGKLRKLMKEQAKGTGLHIGNYTECWYLSGTRWEVYFEKRYVPKEILAMIMEIAGVIPGPGEQILVDKAGVQYEVQTFTQAFAQMTPKDADLTETNVIIMTPSAAMRLFQTDTGEIYYTENAVAQMIDSAYCEQYEEGIEECFLYNDRICWTSKGGYFSIRTYGDINPELIKDLRMIDLSPKRGKE